LPCGDIILNDVVHANLTIETAIFGIGGNIHPEWKDIFKQLCSNDLEPLFFPHWIHRDRKMGAIWERSQFNHYTTILVRIK
jgi:hypothetical protein